MSLPGGLPGAFRSAECQMFGMNKTGIMSRNDFSFFKIVQAEKLHALSPVLITHLTQVGRGYVPAAVNFYRGYVPAVNSGDICRFQRITRFIREQPSYKSFFLDICHCIMAVFFLLFGKRRGTPAACPCIPNVISTAGSQSYKIRLRFLAPLGMTQRTCQGTPPACPYMSNMLPATLRGFK